MNKKLVLFICCCVLSSCASVLTLKKEPPIVETNSHSANVCFNKKSISWRNYGMASEFIDRDTTSSINAPQVKLIESEIKKFSSIDCYNIMNRSELVLSNIPLENRRVLLLLNIVSFGIIPYWAEHENSLTVKTFDQDNKPVATYVSSYKYERIQSIFLWPWALFKDSGSSQLNIRTIPMHFKNFNNAINEKQALK